MKGCADRPPRNMREGDSSPPRASYEWVETEGAMGRWPHCTDVPAPGLPQVGSSLMASPVSLWTGFPPSRELRELKAQRRHERHPREGGDPGHVSAWGARDKIHGGTVRCQATTLRALPPPATRRHMAVGCNKRSALHRSTVNKPPAWVSVQCGYRLIAPYGPNTRSKISSTWFVWYPRSNRASRSPADRALETSGSAFSRARKSPPSSQTRMAFFCTRR